MIRAILYTVWLWKHREEWEAYLWFKSHDCSLQLSPVHSPYAFLHTPNGCQIVGLSSSQNLVELKKRCQIVWRISEGCR